MNKEYRFKCNHRGWIGAIVFLLLFSSFIIFVNPTDMFNLQQAIQRTLESILGNWQVANIVGGVTLYFVIPVLVWKLIFSFAQADGFLGLYKDHVIIKLREKEHVVKYNQIRNTFVMMHFGGMGIELTDGSEVRIVPSYKLSIRDLIAVTKFISAIDKELKRRRGRG